MDGISQIVYTINSILNVIGGIIMAYVAFQLAKQKTDQHWLDIVRIVLGIYFAVIYVYFIVYENAIFPCGIPVSAFITRPAITIFLFVTIAGLIIRLKEIKAHGGR